MFVCMGLVAEGSLFAVRYVALPSGQDSFGEIRNSAT